MSVLLEDNKEKILDLLKKHNFVRVCEFVDLLQVSDMTVRRYLSALDRAGLLRRVRGGAVLVTENETSIPNFTIDDTEAQTVIAQAACRVIQPGDVILLGNGNILKRMARYINIPVTVVVTCVHHALTLLPKKNINVYLCGGQIEREHLNLHGNLAEEALEHVFVDKAFITVGGINREGQLTDIDDQEARLQKVIIRRAKKTFLLLENLKFGNTKFSYVEDLRTVDYLITEKRLDEHYISLCAQAGVELITCCDSPGGDSKEIEESVTDP